MAIKSCFLYSFIILGIIHAFNAASFRCYLPDNQSLKNFIEAPLNRSSEIEQFLKGKLKIILYAFGLNGTVDGPATTLIITAYMNSNANTQDKALCVIDWEKEAEVMFTDLGYVKVRENAKGVGVNLGNCLCTFVKNGVLNVFHLVAHSIGALLMAYAGRTFFKCSNGTSLPCITGLDPAGPLNYLDNLKSTDASLVVGLHTNPGGFGTALHVGGIDFWVNCNNKIQPGCPTDPIELLTEQGAQRCSHNRSYMLHAEAIKTPNAFPAACVSSCSVWRSQSVPTTRINYYGENTDPNITGNCYFSTKSSSPYSKGQAGLISNEQQ